jgi:hypothetical protein
MDIGGKASSGRITQKETLMKPLHILKFYLLLTIFLSLLIVAAGHDIAHTYASKSGSSPLREQGAAITPTPTPTSTVTPPPASWCAGFNNDCWAIFATSHGETSGPSTFIEAEPAFQPPVGFAFANVHSNGSFQVGNHDPIMGQVTYHTPGGCTNCFNALLLPENKSQELLLPDFEAYRALAESEALASAQYLTGDVVWGETIDDGSPPMISSGVWYISGTLTIENGSWAATESALIYVSGAVNISGVFLTEELAIISDGAINISGTLRNLAPFGSTESIPLFQDNRAVLWSNQSAIYINTTLLNPLPPAYSADNDIRGAILAPYGQINFGADQRNNIARGTLIGNTVFVNSNANTGAAARIQYNGNYFPYQPPASVVGAVTLQGRPAAPDEGWSVPLTVSLIDVSDFWFTYSFTPTTDFNGHFTLTDIWPGIYEVRVKKGTSLQNSQTITLSAGSNTIDLGILREGDANDDNLITIVDFSILAATFALCEGDDGYDARADFNGDGCILITDFSLLASNFGESGDD